MITTPDLRALASLADFSDADLEKLCRIAAPRTIRKGEVLYEQLESAEACLLLVRGRLQVERTRISGTYVVMGIEPGSFVGQIALVDRGKRTAAVRAAEDSEGLEIGAKVFDRLLTGADPLALAFQEQLAVACIRQFRGVMERLAALPARRGTDVDSARAAQLDAVQVVELPGLRPQWRSR